MVQLICWCGTALLVATLLVNVDAAYDPKVIVVTGAGGRTGSLLYKKLKAEGVEVRAVVRNVTDATKTALGCNKCDVAEGIYEGDVTVPSSLAPAFAGADAVAIAVGVGEGATAKEMSDVEFQGVINQATVLSSNGTTGKLTRIVLCSSMGTTDPHPQPYEGGPVLFWKLNAEAFLGSLGTKVESVVVKPCGLGNGPGSSSTLLLGHNDDLFAKAMPPMVDRADVARVMASAVLSTAERGNLRFDLCAASGRATPDADLPALLDQARWPWSPARSEL